MLFILGLPKSGTSLLMTLLDNHDDLLVYPVETRFLHLKDVPFEEGWDAVIADLISRSGFATFNPDSDSCKTESNNTQKEYLDSVNFEEFTEELGNHAQKIKDRPVTINRIFKTFAKAYASVKYGKKIDEFKYIVEKTPENEFQIAKILREFPSASFLYILRNPLDNAASFLKYQDGKNTDRSYTFFHKILSSINTYLKNCNKDCLLIKYEDLVHNPKWQMKKVANFLSIELSETLLSPTIAGGNEWKGNSTLNYTYSEVRPSAVGTYKEKMNQVEIEVIAAAVGIKTLLSRQFLINFLRLDTSILNKIKILVYIIHSRIFLRKALKFIRSQYET